MERPQRLIVIGASAGGMPALAALTAQLPRSLPAAVLVVQHLAPASDGQQLADRMARHTGLTAGWPSTATRCGPATCTWPRPTTTCW